MSCPPCRIRYILHVRNLLECRLRLFVPRGYCWQTTADYNMAQGKLDCFFRHKVPRLEERVQDDGNSGEDDDEEGNVANKDQEAVPLRKELVPECMAVEIHMVSL